MPNFKLKVFHFFPKAKKLFFLPHPDFQQHIEIKLDYNPKWYIVH